MSKVFGSKKSIIRSAAVLALGVTALAPLALIAASPASAGTTGTTIAVPLAPKGDISGTACIDNGGKMTNGTCLVSYTVAAGSKYTYPLAPKGHISGTACIDNGGAMKAGVCWITGTAL